LYVVFTHSLNHVGPLELDRANSIATTKLTHLQCGKKVPERFNIFFTNIDKVMRLSISIIAINVYFFKLLKLFYPLWGTAHEESDKILK
jgi:hypothetical protein